jgi:hypothetical protein
MHPTIDLDRVRQRLAALADLAQEPALVEALEPVIGRARAVREASSKRSALNQSRAQPPERHRPRTPRKKK